VSSKDTFIFSGFPNLGTLRRQMLFSDGRTGMFLQLQNTSADVVACLFLLFFVAFFSASYQQPAPGTAASILESKRKWRCMLSKSSSQSMDCICCFTAATILVMFFHAFALRTNQARKN
jgi:hypothetical protein